MDVLINILVVIHLVGLVFVMGSGISMARIGPMYGQSNDDQRRLIFRMGAALTKNANLGLAMLFVTGPLLIWLKYGGFSGISHWFWVKMLLVVCLGASIGIGSKAFKKFAAGDMGASAKVAIMRKVSVSLGVLIVLCAVITFG